MSNAQRPDYYSAEEYLSKEEQALTKSEYVDGWIRAMGGSTLRHNKLKGNCYFSLRSLLKGNTCQPFDSDTKVRIDREGKS
jgi:hypothetical protein